MGHHSKKNTQNTPTPMPNPLLDINKMGQILNNIDINSMSNTLNNMDINQVMSVLSKAFTPQTNASSGINPNNAGNSIPNVSPADIPNNTSNSSPAAEFFNSLNAFNIPNTNPINTPAQPPFSPVLPANDPTVMILNSLKPFLPPDKCTIIDNMIQLYGIKTVIDKIFPPSIPTNNVNVKNNTDVNKSEEQLNDKQESINNVD